MVGVPGRSKGCVTCRKRKKGCDLQVPACGQCKDRGIVCGGYDSDRIFIYQTVGSNRPARGAGRSAYTDLSAHSSINNTCMQLTPVRPVPWSGSPSTNRPQPISVLLPEHLMRSAYSDKTIEAFVRMYVPQGNAAATKSANREFMDMLPLLSIRDEALQLAILAIGSAALGRSTGDQELSRRGRAFYGKALTETSMALRNPARAKSEALLVVPRVMALFEILFGAQANSTHQAKSWLSHAEGETAMVLARNPEEYSKTDAAHALFVSSRARLLIPAVRTRKATILNSPAWKTLPWTGRTKTPKDVLVDIFCGLPALLEAVDHISSSTLSKKNTEHLQIHTIAKCYTLHSELEDWLAANPTLTYTPKVTDTPTPITFPDIDIACLTVRYWTVALILYSCLDIASGIQPSTDFSTTHADRPHPRVFARFIARSSSFFFQEQYGVTGATAISFPLGNALLYMKRNPAADAQYMGMVMKAWSDPLLPSAIRDFLASMKQSVTFPAMVAKPLSEL